MSNTVSILLVLCTLFCMFISEGPRDPGLIQEVKPNFDAVKGLICYQCRSNTSELQPLCDKSIFRLATPQEKYNMSLQCPHYQGAYCFTKTTTHGKYTETIRGCSGPTDKNGYMMKSGCMKTKDVVLCLCETKFCNKATAKFPSIEIAVVFMIIRNILI